MQRLNFSTPFLDDRGLIAPYWQRALTSIDEGSLGGDAWTQYTPQVEGNGTMIVSGVSGNCVYKRSKDVCVVNCYVGFITSGTGTPFVAFSLPFPYAASFGSFVPLNIWGSTGVPTWICGIANTLPGSSQLLIYAGRNSTSNFANGFHAFAGTFSYPC